MMGLAGFVLVLTGVVALFDDNVKADYGWAYAAGCILLGAILTTVNRLTGGDDD